MDDKHFDRLAEIACTGSRRDCVFALGGALFTMLFARSNAFGAQLEGSVVLGGACSTASQCRQQDMQAEAICADNGFTSDGALTCCVESGCCTTDADCCGDLRCAPAPDVCSVCLRPPFATRFVGQLCIADSDCVPSVTCEIGCIQGRCNCIEEGVWSPEPGSTPPPDIPDAEAALAAAVNLSRLEVDGRFDALYDLMHPDAQQVVPREAVVGWYREEFAPSGPEVAEAVKVRFVPWTWAVTGQTYPETAEVAYRQRFADGAEVRGEVRLVKDWHGNWSWFFGRSRAFIEEQIALYAEN